MHTVWGHDWCQALTHPARLEAQPLAMQWLLRIAAHAYRQRQHVCLIRFGAGGAELIQPPMRAAAPNTHAPLLHAHGCSPVQAALELLGSVWARYQRHTRGSVTHTLWLLSDGRFAPLPARPAWLQDACIINLENPAHVRVPLGRCIQLAALWDVPCVDAHQP